MDDRERSIRQRLKDDFVHYAEKNLKIRTKTGSVESLILNTAQRFIHNKLEQQLKETGRVRALILKGRQQGCSTYTEGRFYWKVTHRFGVQAFILTHEQAATDNLFKMVVRYHEHSNELLRPPTSASNAKELIFNEIDSGYKLGTAGTKGTGRSSTIQYLHGSEVAFWPHADDHAAGVMQAIPDADGTEVILESTANGIGNYFHTMWQQAEAGLSEYIAVFIPWFWQVEYGKPAPEDFRPDDEEAEYMELYRIDRSQCYWMRTKVQEFKGDWSLFHQEYPATPALAFQTSGEESLIKPAHVAKARKHVVDDAYGAIVAGLDPARFGDDRTAFIIRQGRKAHTLITWQKKNTMEVVGLAAKLVDEHNIERLFVDVGGLGAGVVDRLRELPGMKKIVTAVNAGERPIMAERYLNKRAEMWDGMNDWLKAGNVQIPDDDALHGDLCGPSYSYDSNQRLKLEKKEDMKKRGIRSPDAGDALAMTFAYPVAVKNPIIVNIDRERQEPDDGGFMSF